MPQKLRFPFKKGMLICSYKTQQYKKSWGYDHFGIDISSYQGYANPSLNDHTIYASGHGKVVVCEYDKPTNGAKSLGYCIAIQYDDCEAHNGTVKNLVLRYMHCDTTFVSVGDIVELGTPISIENKIGTGDYHLHLEADTDLKYPKYSPQVAKGHSGWIHGTDSSVDIADYLWVDKTFTQTKYSFSNRSWIHEKDDILPTANDSAKAPTSTNDVWKDKYDALVKKLKDICATL